MQIWEILKGKRGRTGAGKRSTAVKSDARTDFEKNATKLRSERQKLKPQRPIAPVKNKT